MGLNTARNRNQQYSRNATVSNQSFEMFPNVIDNIDGKNRHWCTTFYIGFCNYRSSVNDANKQKYDS
jgi:hypothetical protein